MYERQGVSFCRGVNISLRIMVGMVFLFLPVAVISQEERESLDPLASLKSLTYHRYKSCCGDDSSLLK